MSITGWPSRKANVPTGSERSSWYVGLPRITAASGNWWYNARADVNGAAGFTGIVTGAAGTYTQAFDAINGGVRLLSGVNNAAPVYQTLAPNGISFLPPPMGAPLGGLASQSAGVVIYRELIQLAYVGAIPAAAIAIHGFSLLGNLIGGFPLLGAGSWRGIAIVQRAADCVLAIKANGGVAATTIALPGIDLTVGRTLVEHRIYYPTATRMGRYELHLNGNKVQEIAGNHPQWPVQTAANQAWIFLPFAMDNPGTATVTQQRAWWGEIIVGPDSPGTY